MVADEIKKAVEQHLATKKGAQASYPFGAEALVFKVMGKMFALVSQKDETPRITLKCKPADGMALVSQFATVTPGYYMNKKHWITIALSGELSTDMIINLSNDSYDLVVSKLSKADKNKLAEQS